MTTRGGNAVVQTAFHVEGLADSTRYPPVRHDGGAEGRVGRSQGGAEQEGVPRIHSQHDSGGNGAQRDGQWKAQCQQPQVSSAVRSEIGDPYPAGVGEQHPDQRDFGDDLDQVGVQFKPEQLEALRHDDTDGYEEDRCRDCRRPRRERSPDEDRGQDQTQRT